MRLVSAVSILLNCDNINLFLKKHFNFLSAETHAGAVRGTISLSTVASEV